MTWRKSSHSNAGNGACVEVAVSVERVGVRDSKNVTGPTLAFEPATWRAFTGRAARPVR
jgi:uncharacterized protein DUF397